MLVAAVCATSGPQATLGGGISTWGRVRWPPGGDAWDDALGFHSRLLAAYVCATAYFATMVRTSVRGRGWATRLGGVMALLGTVVLLNEIGVTRREMGERESTGWGLWSLVPFVPRGCVGGAAPRRAAGAVCL